MFDLLKLPRFKGCFHVEILDKDTVCIFSELDTRYLSGSLFASLARLINGERSTDSIVEQLESRFDPATIYHALIYLKKKGFLEESDSRVSQEISAFWALMGVNASLAISKLSSASVGILSLSGFHHGRLKDLLKDMKVRQVRKQYEKFITHNPGNHGLNTETLDVIENCDLFVVSVSNYLNIWLEKLSRTLQELKKPWILFKPAGVEIWIGPLIVPGETGCFECLLRHLKANKNLEIYLCEKVKGGNPLNLSRTINTPIVTIAESILALEVVKILGGARDVKIKGNILTLNMQTWEMRHHEITKHPQCPLCGKHKLSLIDKHSLPDPPKLKSRKIIFDQDGGQRICLPEYTLSIYEHLISPISGVVKSLKSASDQLPSSVRNYLKIYIAEHSIGTRIKNLSQFKDPLFKASSGKGMTDVQAKASALCEALEQYCGMFHMDEPRIKMRFEDLKEAAIHPSMLLQYSKKQYEERERWNNKGKYAFVANPFDDDWEIEWTPVWSLSFKTWKWVPTAFCYYSYEMPEAPEFARADSNGNASGNCIEEAILQGLLELVERDAVGIWWYNRLKRPSLDLKTIPCSFVKQYLNAYDMLDRDIWVLDITSDLGIPVFAALSSKKKGERDEPIMGFGSNLNPQIALSRALTEMNQMLLFQCTQDPGDDMTPKSYALDFVKNSRIAELTYLAPDTYKEPVPFSQHRDMSTEDLLKDILICRSILEQKGMEILILDQTRQEIGLPVAKVIVPGLRHFWARFAPGRLYDVPVELGWLDEPLKEEDLNPIPFFF